MTAIEVLTSRGLMCWSVAFCGLKRGWVGRNDVSAFAEQCMRHGDETPETAMLAWEDTPNDSEFLQLVAAQARKNALDASAVADRWRFAKLVEVAESDESEQVKIDVLQSVYADFGYPEDMCSCSIYEADGKDPLDAMSEVISALKRKTIST